MINATLDIECGTRGGGVNGIIRDRTRDAGKPCADDTTIAQGSAKGALEIAGTATEGDVDAARSG
jgi:hypothetical protein